MPSYHAKTIDDISSAISLAEHTAIAIYLDAMHMDIPSGLYEDVERDVIALRQFLRDDLGKDLQQIYAQWRKQASGTPAWDDTLAELNGAAHGIAKGLALNLGVRR